MKIFEMSFRDGDNAEEDSFTFWLATDRKFTSPTALYIKEIKEYNENTPGVDLIIT